jgi:hypothetical protein
VAATGDSQGDRAEEDQSAHGRNLSPAGYGCNAVLSPVEPELGGEQRPAQLDRVLARAGV